MKRPREVLPGLLLLGAIGGVAWVVGDAVPLLSPLVVAVVAGMLVGNVVGIPSRAAPGVGTH
jgi:uncharacterized membrane protein YadS